MIHEWNHAAYGVGYHEHVQTLTESQKAFPYLLDDWIKQPRNMKVIVAGGPGTGKSYTVISCLDHVDIVQLRMAPTARVAQKMNGFTIHSAMKLAWGPKSQLQKLEKELIEEQDKEVCLKKSAVLMNEFNCPYQPDIVVIDEVGMIAFWLLEWIFEYFFTRPNPILFIVMGDPNQLRPVKSLHNVFTAGVEAETKFIHLRESKRFEKEYGEVIKQLSKYVDDKDETGMFTFLCGHYPVVDNIDTTILKKCTRALAYLKSSVESYNDFYLKHLISGPKYRLWRKNERVGNNHVDVKEGCLIFLIQNGVSTATNGTPLKFTRYNQETDAIECENVLNGDVVVIKRNLYGDFPITVGFAGTIHKFQGDTMDDTAIAINFNGSRDLNLVYTALSRVRSMSQIVAIQL